MRAHDPYRERERERERERKRERERGRNHTLCAFLLVLIVYE